MSNLQLTVTSGKLNKSFELIGKMDCYVKVVVDNAEYKTAIVKGSKNVDIVWNQTLNIPLRNLQSQFITIYIMDEDMTRDDVCGQGRVHLSHCGVLNPGVNRYQLRLFDTEYLEINGELNFTTRYL